MDYKTLFKTFREICGSSMVIGGSCADVYAYLQFSFNFTVQKLAATHSNLCMSIGCQIRFLFLYTAMSSVAAVMYW